MSVIDVSVLGDTVVQHMRTEASQGHQVWLRERLVGYLAVPFPQKGKQLVYETQDAGSVFLDIIKRGARISRMDVEMARSPATAMTVFRQQYHVPDNAEQSVDLATDSLCFSWWTYRVNDATHEAIFDLPEFEPA